MESSAEELSSSSSSLSSSSSSSCPSSPLVTPTVPEGPREELPPPPEELVDPITLTLLEDAVVGPCGHSYSKETITKWLSTGPRSECPVCKTAITQQQLIPNWGLRNAVERYELAHGLQKKQEEKKPVEPKGENVKLDVGASHRAPTQPQPQPPQQPQPQQPRPPQPRPQRQPHPQPPPPPPPPPPVQPMERVCVCINVPVSPSSCCGWGCKNFGLCVGATRCQRRFKYVPASSSLCSLSFGPWSTWYSRSICGALFPLFVVLLVLALVVDAVYLMTIVALAGVGSWFLLIVVLPLMFCFGERDL